MGTFRYLIMPPSDSQSAILNVIHHSVSATRFLMPKYCAAKRTLWTFSGSVRWLQKMRYHICGTKTSKVRQALTAERLAIGITRSGSWRMCSIKSTTAWRVGVSIGREIFSCAPGQCAVSNNCKCSDEESTALWLTFTSSLSLLRSVICMGWFVVNRFCETNNLK